MRTFERSYERPFERTFERSFERSGERMAPRSPEQTRRDVRALLACITGVALVVGSLVLLVLMRMGDVQAGYELYALQKRKVELTQRRSALVLELAALKRPDRLAREGAALGLAPPRADQVLRVAPRQGTAHDEGGRR